MDVLDNCEVIDYECGQTDKYTGATHVERCTIYYKNGLRHRDNDLPAYYSLYEIKWYKNGLLHRDTYGENNQLLPAVEVCGFPNPESLYIYYLDGIEVNEFGQQI